MAVLSVSLNGVRVWLVRVTPHIVDLYIINRGFWTISPFEFIALISSHMRLGDTVAIETLVGSTDIEDDIQSRL